MTRAAEIAGRHELPLLSVRWGRDYYRMEGWSLHILLAPFPVAEAVEGELFGALLNGEICIRSRWPFVRCHFYAPRRDRSASRAHLQAMGNG